MARLFFSYSHKDEGFRDDLETHLAMLKRQGIIEPWHDRRIQAGDEWKGEISEQLEAADIILLLVSPYFLASEYCYDVEMQRALQRHESGSARVIPVILEPCDWKSAPFGKLQAATKDGRPISKYPNKHDGFLEVVHAIRAVAQSSPAPLSKPVKPASVTAARASYPSENRSSNLRIKKTFSDHERDSFRLASFEYIANFFEQSLNELKDRNPEITFGFRRISANHFTAIVYRTGKAITQCGIRLSSGIMGSQILYSSQPDSTSSWNESLSVEDDGHSLLLKATGASSMLSGRGNEGLSQEGAAELYWLMLMEPLQR